MRRCFVLLFALFLLPLLRFLAPDHPYRRDPSFGPNELRPPPPLRSLNGENGGVGSIVSVEIAQDADFPLSFHQVKIKVIGCIKLDVINDQPYIHLS